MVRSIVEEVMGVEPEPFRFDVILPLAAVQDVAQGIVSEIEARMGVEPSPFVPAMQEALLVVGGSAQTIATNTENHIIRIEVFCPSFTDEPACLANEYCTWMASHDPACVYVEYEPCPCWTTPDNIVTQFTSVPGSGDGIQIKTCSLAGEFPEIVANSSMTFAAEIDCNTTHPDPGDVALGLHVTKLDMYGIEPPYAGLKCEFNFPRCGHVIQPPQGSLTAGQVLGCRRDIREAGEQLCP